MQNKPIISFSIPLQVMVFRISEISNMEEVDAHSLEVLYAKLKIRQLKDKENMRSGANTSMGNNSLSNSMAGSFTGTAGGASMPANSAMGGRFGNNPKHEMTYKMIMGCSRDEGLSRDEIFAQLKGRMTQADVDGSLDYLSSDGHIYSTIDDNHFKAIDS